MLLNLPTAVRGCTPTSWSQVFSSRCESRQAAKSNAGLWRWSRQFEFKNFKLKKIGSAIVEMALLNSLFFKRTKYLIHFYGLVNSFLQKTSLIILGRKR